MPSSKHFVPRIETALHAQLSKIQGNIRPKQRRESNDIRDPMTNPMSLGVDGTDHINIWDSGSSDLGRALAHSTRLPFKHPIFGRFNNIESFWHYIRSNERDDRIRAMHGTALKRFASKLTVVRVTNFCAIIMDANWQKVKQYPDIAEAIKESTLPFDCYYVYKRKNGVRIRPSFAYWVIKGFEEIRKALKEDRLPNFDSMMDNASIGLFGGVLPKTETDSDPDPKPVRQHKPKFVNNKPAALTQPPVVPVIETEPTNVVMSIDPGVVSGDAFAVVDSSAAFETPVEVQSIPIEIDQRAVVEETVAVRPLDVPVGPGLLHVQV